MYNLILALILLSLGYVTARLAEEKGRNAIAWFFIGMFTGIFGVLIILLLPSLHANKEEDLNFKEIFQDKESEKEKNIQKNELISSDWFYMPEDKKEKGPLPFQELVERWKDGTITKDTYLWKEGMPDWSKSSDIPYFIGCVEEKSYPKD